MLTMTKPVVSSPLLINLSLTLDWAEHSLMLPPQSQEQYEVTEDSLLADSQLSDFYTGATTPHYYRPTPTYL